MPKPSRGIALIGTKLWRFTVLRVVRRGKKTECECQCDCGAVRYVSVGQLEQGTRKSCGCYRREFIAARNITHDAAYSHDYNLWSHIRQRCENSKNIQYKNYGGRGISMCDRWRHSFANFISDMGPRPSLKYSIERIDNNGDYEPSNCKWELKSKQHGNTRTNRRVEIDGETLIVAEWARRCGLPQHIIKGRLDRGWAAKDAVTKPIDTRFGRGGGRKKAVQQTRISLASG